MRNPVTIAGQACVILSQQITTGTTAAQLPAAPQPAGGVDANQGDCNLPAFVEKVILQADPSNTTNNILIGTSTDQHFALVAGASIVLELMDPTKIWFKASAATPLLNVLYLGH